MTLFRVALKHYLFLTQFCFVLLCYVLFCFVFIALHTVNFVVLYLCIVLVSIVSLYLWGARLQAQPSVQPLSLTKIDKNK